MSTEIHEHSPSLPPAIRGRLDALRAAIRRYVWLEGMAAAAVWLGAAFWGSMAIDWLFESPKPIRAGLLAVAGVGLAVVLFLFVLRRAFVRLSDANMATVLERQFPQFNDSLLTSVSLGSLPGSPDTVNPAMLVCTTYLAQKRLEKVSIRQVFNPMPVVRKVVIALGLAATIVALAVLDPADLDLWTQRNILLGNATWPRKIRLEAVGFNDGVAKVAAGANFDLRVRAFRGDTEIPVIPSKVEIRFRRDDGGRERKTMKNIGRPSASADVNEVLQEYSYAFTGVLSSVHIDVVGGDGRIYDLLLKVVPNPTLNLALECEYPAYIERKPLTIDSVSPAVPVRVPVGSRVTIHGRAEKPLEMARIDGPAVEGKPAWFQQYAAADLGADRKDFTYTFYPFPAPKAGSKAQAAGSKEQGETALQFSVRDTDGLKLREPLFLSLVAIPDEPPEVKVRMVGTREPCVTPKGRVPVTGTITDDHGLAKAWFDYTVEERAPAALPEARDGVPRKRAALHRKMAVSLSVPASAMAKCSWRICLSTCPSIPLRRLT